MNKKQLMEVLKNSNVKAFLEMIRECEGTNYPDGYRYMFGSTPKHPNLMIDYKDHPRKYFDYTNRAGRKLHTSAAGAYQFIVKTWDALQEKLDLSDFSPTSQDIAAIQLIFEQKALNDIVSGHFKEAINKVRKIWASLPGSGNDQPEKSFLQASSFYQKAGGVIA